ncbi:MAG: redoxin domain-containing protein [Gammaproteobacteria bacterium]|nr:redoxin domain-containing protein [Gammaproteobacteria bacterium]
MTHRLPRLTVIAALLAASVSAMPVDNFALTDQTGTGHELFDEGDARAIVLMVQGNGCPVVRNALVDLTAVRKRFEGEPVRFLMINSNLQDDDASIRAEAEAWGIDLPVLVDDTQQVGEALALTRTAEALVIDARSRSIAYRGPINDRLVYERQRKEAGNHYVIDAVTAVLAGERPVVTSIDAIGCLINFPGRDQVSAPRDKHHHH